MAILAIYANNTGITDSKPALKMIIITGVDDNNTVQVMNMSFKQTTVPFYFKRADSPAKFPEINVYARYNEMATEPVSYWASAFRPNDEGIYTLTMTFKDGKEPKVGDLLLLPIKITDSFGNQESRTTSFYIWKNESR